MKTALFVSLNSDARGENIHGIFVAKKIHKQGINIVYIATKENKILLKDFPFRFYLLNQSQFEETINIIENIIRKDKIDYIILADYFTNSVIFRKYKLSLKILSKFNLPLFCIDTWNSKITGQVVDFIPNIKLNVDRYDNIFVNSIVPSPVASIISTQNNICNFLSNANFNIVKSQYSFKEQLGISDSSKIILFCTSRWQTSFSLNNDSKRIYNFLTEFLVYLFLNLPKEIILIHIGETSFNNCQYTLKERYIRLPFLSPSDFNRLFYCIDILLSANIASTLIAKAISYRKPVINLFNSLSNESLQNSKKSMIFENNNKFESVLKRASPIYPFYLWPTGMYFFLKPLINNNDLLGAILNFEITDITKTIETINKLLFNKNFYLKTIDNIYKYNNKLKSLTNVDDIIMKFINAS